MKILGICASPRGSKSTTLRLVQALLKGAKEAGAEVELVDVCDLDIKFCNACQVCFKTGVCVHKDDFQGLYDKILAADGLVWGSPNYFHTVTAQMKTLIDRMADAVHCQLLTGKYCASVASGGSNFDQVTTYLDGLMINFGAFVTGSIGVAMNQGPAAMEDAERKATLLGKSLAEDIRIKRDYIEQREMQEEIREYFKALVKMNKDSWEHEYEYWNRLNWN
ncbi:MAG: iron sulfur flavoprotein [Methanosaeta sp. NSM2]|nr:flavodoxin family protein [Methanothrix sp.]OYV13999.1 MAG: iron sulfur flavoprotein [Methanosaeta sp. NSM2]